MSRKNYFCSPEGFCTKILIAAYCIFGRLDIKTLKPKKNKKPNQ